MMLLLIKQEVNMSKDTNTESTIVDSNNTIKERETYSFTISNKTNIEVAMQQFISNKIKIQQYRNCNEYDPPVKNNRFQYRKDFRETHMNDIGINPVYLQKEIQSINSYTIKLLTLFCSKS